MMDDYFLMWWPLWVLLLTFPIYVALADKKQRK